MARKFNNVVLPDNLELLYLDGNKFQLTADYNIYWSDRGRDYRLRVPAGYVTDLSSIPRVARSIIPVIGRQNGPSVIHDFIYEPCDPDLEAPGKPYLNGWTKPEADMLFLEAMKAAKVNWYRRNAMWVAVRFGGYRAWNTRSK